MSANYPTQSDAAERPPSVPEEGVVPAFDAGWDGHAAGMTREGVRFFAAAPGWALLGWDARETVASGERAG